jgi:hypothetical protein
LVKIHINPRIEEKPNKGLKATLILASHLLALLTASTCAILISSLGEYIIVEANPNVNMGSYAYMLRLNLEFGHILSSIGFIYYFIVSYQLRVKSAPLFRFALYSTLIATLNGIFVGTGLASIGHSFDIRILLFFGAMSATTGVFTGVFLFYILKISKRLSPYKDS